jgi:hypothetical protein
VPSPPPARRGRAPSPGNTPALVVQIRNRPLVRLLDQAGAEHPLDGAVQRARSHRRGSAGDAFDLLHDAVAVPILIGERQQDVGDRGGQRQKVSGIRGLVRHTSVTDISYRIFRLKAEAT